MKPFLRQHKSLLLFALAVFAAALCLMLLFSAGTECVRNRRLLPYLFGPDALLAALPALALRARWRVLSPVGIWLMAFFLWSNMMFFRYWGDLPALALAFSPESYNSFVFNSIGGLTHWWDIFFLLIPAGVTAAWYMMHISRLPHIGKKAAIIAAAIVALSFPLGQTRIIIAAWRNEHRIDPDSKTTFCESLRSQYYMRATRIAELNSLGLTPYAISQFVAIFRDNTIELTDGQRAEIRRAIAAAPGPTAEADSIFAANRTKNVFLIIVESLNAGVLDRKVDGREITPTLNALLRSPGTISCLEMVTQVRDGGSSDGHLLYNTGLLPLSADAAALRFGNNVYPSLAKALGYARAADIIVEDARVWNHRTTSSAYGYDTLVQCQKLADQGRLSFNDGGYDGAVLGQGLAVARKLQQPFLVEIITLGMHYPFTDRYSTNPAWLDNQSSLTTYERNYLARCHDFDRELGRFIQGLKDAGLYDCSLLFIVSDHAQTIDRATAHFNNEGHEKEFAVFIAANTGLSRRIAHPAGQVDVFPTLLDICGRLARASWRGLGRSMLNPALSGATAPDGTGFGSLSSAEAQRQADAYRLCDLIIRSNYFKNQ